MKALSLKSTMRKTTGKCRARLLRRGGMIPAMLYGPNADSVKLSVESVEFRKLLSNSKANQFLLNLTVNGIVKKVTIKEMQKHPVFGNVLHIDFYEVAMDRKIKVSIPVVPVGTCKGVEFGGMLQIIRRKIDVLCLPDEIPKSIVIDITDLDIGDSFHVMDTALPDGISLPGETNFTILTVLSQRTVEEEGMAKEIDNESDEISEN